MRVCIYSTVTLQPYVGYIIVHCLLNGVEVLAEPKPQNKITKHLRKNPTNPVYTYRFYRTLDLQTFFKEL